LSPSEKVDWLHKLGKLASTAQQSEQACELFQQALALNVDGVQISRVQVMYHLALIYRNSGDTKNAYFYGVRALQTADEMGDHAFQMKARQQIAEIEQARGNANPALMHYLALLELQQESGAKDYIIAQTFAAIATLHVRLGDVERAHKIEAEITSLAEIKPRTLSNIYHQLGIAYQEQGIVEGQIRCFAAAVQHFHGASHERSAAMSSNKTILNAIADIAEKVQAQKMLAAAYQVGVHFAEQINMPQVERFFGIAIDIYRDYKPINDENTQIMTFNAYIYLGLVLRQRGKFDEYEMLTTDLMEFAEQTESAKFIHEAHCQTAMAHGIHGKLDLAIEAFEAAEVVFVEAPLTTKEQLGTLLDMTKRVLTTGTGYNKDSIEKINWWVYRALTTETEEKTECVTVLANELEQFKPLGKWRANDIDYLSSLLSILNGDKLESYNDIFRDDLVRLEKAIKNFVIRAEVYRIKTPPDFRRFADNFAGQMKDPVLFEDLQVYFYALLGSEQYTAAQFLLDQHRDLFDYLEVLQLYRALVHFCIGDYPTGRNILIEPEDNDPDFLARIHAWRGLAASQAGLDAKPHLEQAMHILQAHGEDKAEPKLGLLVEVISEGGVTPRFATYANTAWEDRTNVHELFHTLLYLLVINVVFDNTIDENPHHWLIDNVIGDR